VDVYLVPIGRRRHALYCEPGEEPDAVSVPGREPAGRWKRWTEKFRVVLETVEREHGEADGRDRREVPAGAVARVRTRFMRWLAGAIAEQRLLWRLRGQARVRAFFPQSLDPDLAMTTIRENLASENARHRWWLIVDALGGLVSLALMPFPGPNIPGYYFTFRIVGHLLAIHGARHGLAEVRWELEPCEPLDDLAALADLPAPERERRVASVAARLGLRRLPRFVRRTVLGGA